MKPITSDIGLRTVMLQELPVIVYIGLERIGSGIIEEITETSVKIGGERYMRANCSFWKENKRD
jgi:hypothetical protein